MTGKLTAKDKKLLYGLSIFVIIVVIGRWGIFPLAKEIRQTKVKLEKEEETRKAYEEKIEKIPALLAQKEELEEAGKDKKSKYYPIMTGGEVDQYLTEMATGYGLMAYQLEIDIPKENGVLTSYGEEQSSEELLYQQEWEDDIGVHIAQVSMRLIGKKKDMQCMVDDLYASDKMHRIRSINYSSTREVVGDENGTSGIKESTVLDISLEMYMCDK